MNRSTILRNAKVRKEKNLLGALEDEEEKTEEVMEPQMDTIVPYFVTLRKLSNSPGLLEGDNCEGGDEGTDEEFDDYLVDTQWGERGGETFEETMNNHINTIHPSICEGLCYQVQFRDERILQVVECKGASFPRFARAYMSKERKKTAGTMWDKSWGAPVVLVGSSRRGKIVIVVPSCVVMRMPRLRICGIPWLAAGFLSPDKVTYILPVETLGIPTTPRILTQRPPIPIHTVHHYLLLSILSSDLHRTTTLALTSQEILDIIHAQACRGVGAKGYVTS
ncbi:hypothetical protein BU17DRAFT_66590 [Hysterangium stoloniferum]|nr:hypothetical protein BU17DRAFT_66590 [Hysterangium stoloniferum]